MGCMFKVYLYVFGIRIASVTGMIDYVDAVVDSCKRNKKSPFKWVSFKAIQVWPK